MKHASDRPTIRSPDAVLLGADIGGTHARVAIGRGDARVLGRAEGTGAVMRTGRGERLAGVVAELARRAAKSANLALPAHALVVGAAGTGRERERTELEEAVRHTGIAHQVRTRPDIEVALDTAFGGDPGIVLVAGTGAIAIARDDGGRVHRVGGYGWQMGDEGGGYWIGRRALELAGRAHDGRAEARILLNRILESLQLSAFDDLVRWASEAAPAEVAGLAPAVFAAARDRDPGARSVLEIAAAHLARLAGALVHHFEDSFIPLALTGGLLGDQSPLRALLEPALTEHAPRAKPATHALDGAAAALTLAARLLEDR